MKLKNPETLLKKWMTTSQSLRKTKMSPRLTLASLLSPRVTRLRKKSLHLRSLTRRKTWTTRQKTFPHKRSHKLAVELLITNPKRLHLRRSQFQKKWTMKKPSPLSKPIRRLLTKKKLVTIKRRKNLQFLNKRKRQF
jgi:hypothetical protein